MHNCAYDNGFGALHTPFFANYGKHPCLPSVMRLGKKPSKNPQAYDFVKNIETTIEKAKKCLKDAQHRQKKLKFYNAKHRDVQFEVGDKVWLSKENIPISGAGIGTCKMYLLWLGPFPVT